METVKKVSVSLYPTDRSIVKTLADAKGLDFSSALRVVIREWQEMNIDQQCKQSMEKPA